MNTYSPIAAGIFDKSGQDGNTKLMTHSLSDLTETRT